MGSAAGVANTIVTERADVSGSGIGTVAGFSEAEEGDFDIYAPQGTVNAGDAGIRVSGNFNVFALQILNAANIQVTGDSKGVPVVEAPNIGGLTEAGNTAGVAAQQAATPQSHANEQPSVIIVEVIGFGGSTPGDEPERQDDKKKKGQKQSYNTESPVQVIGNGELSSLQKSQLTERERANYEAN